MTNIDQAATTTSRNTVSNSGDASLGAQQITHDLLDIIRKHTKNAGETWDATTTLEDVGIDSFDLVELIFEIEDKYDISVNFNANRTVDDFATVADVARVIQENLSKEGRAA